MRCIALDIETTPAPEALAQAAANPPDLRPQDPAGVAKLLEGGLVGVGAKSAPEVLRALAAGKPDLVAAFYDLVDSGPAGAVKMRDLCLAAPGLVRGKIKAETGEFLAIIESIHGGMDSWYASLSKSCSLDPWRCRIVSVALAGDGPTTGADGLPVYAEGCLHLGEYGERAGVGVGGGTLGVGLGGFGPGRHCGDEATLLRDLWAYLADLAEPSTPCLTHLPTPGKEPRRGLLPLVLVTFRGLDFDAWVLTVRSLLLGVEMPWSLETARYRYSPVCDLYEYLTRWGKSLSPQGSSQYAHPNGLLARCRAFGIEHQTKAAGMEGSQVAQLVDECRWDELAAYNLDDARATWQLFQRCRSQIPGMSTQTTVERRPTETAAACGAA